MSEYQYYEFLAVDRPLSELEQKELRAISSRARITAASFTNHYEWGDLKGDPKKLVERYFDLHLYFANWAARRLLIRLPKRLVDRSLLDSVLRDVEWTMVSEKGDNLIVDFLGEEVGSDTDEWDDGSSWLAALSPLRADVLSGDYRLFYLAWLVAVEYGGVDAAAVEPLPGIGPLTGALEAFAEFFVLDPDLVAAAAERTGGGGAAGLLPCDAVRSALAAMPDREKTDLLLRVVDGDPHVAAELKSRMRTSVLPPPADLRTAGDLRARAAAIREERERLRAEKLEAERRRKEKQAEKARRARLEAVKRRGLAVWDQIEAEIERRNASGYDTAMDLLVDLEAIATEHGTGADFAQRVEGIRERHVRKGKFIERLKGLAPR
ncbi:MAG: hypothetical protein HYX38_26150 [Rhodospirillales bacterium]|nr:hypothetical protein [Rhodospirillales bacterium]